MNSEPAQPQITPDPNLAIEQKQAQDNLVKNLQNEAQIDTASILSRYGTMQALSSAGMGKGTF